ncbi:hypothetical protein CAL14_19700 [Bordetella genomosp. 9]|uniref:acyltransferase family protein n=1 Tax=Bordetella genomosp. 9 TaxID=1416803 RepID=UPI000A294763|nr:acyltransferase [Bordetella genomosp. 9]ARP92233.1 hypothetical protein CAL14_19700 [Bordetella genomosp. 9]
MPNLSNLVRPVAYPAIDGLRTYAAISVFALHIGGGAVTEYFGVPGHQLSYKADAWTWRFLMYVLDGNHGVDVFFVISGFLMARIVLSQRERFSYGRFLSHRFWRIYPAFLVSLVVTAVADVHLFNWPWKPVDFFKNLVFLNAVPSLEVLPYNHVTWSLGYEFAFYIIIPLLTLLARFIDSRVAALILGVAAFWLLPNGYSRMLGMFAGALVGSMHDDALRRVAKALPLWLVVLAFLACGILKAVWFNSFGSYYYAFLPLATLAFVKIVWDDSNVLSRFFSSLPLRALGTLSYSIYLLHPVIASTALHRFTPLPPSLGGLVWYIVTSFIVTVAAAYCCYMLVERRYFMRRSSETKVAVVTANT